MPNWAGSSWYFLRYIDSKNQNAFADPKKLAHFMPIDWYNGGMEHVTLHLLYSRFWNLFLYDLGFVPTKEPYKKRTAHGMILAADGKKMSKSVGNVVNPDDLVKEFGGDALRLYELFIGPFDQAVQWDPRGILGTARFLEKVWRIGSVVASTRSNPSFASDSKLASLLNKTVQKVGADIEAANFNTAVSAMMIFVNELAADNLQLTVQDWQKFLLILSPFAPHIAEELNEMLSREPLCESAWPKVDEASIAESTYELIIQVNSRVRATFDIKKGTSQAEVERLVAEIPEVQKWLTAPAKRVIFVKDRLINFIV
jgi:leucyl-tRNA synthetase